MSVNNGDMFYMFFGNNTLGVFTDAFTVKNEYNPQGFTTLTVCSIGASSSTVEYLCSGNPTLENMITFQIFDASSITPSQLSDNIIYAPGSNVGVNYQPFTSQSTTTINTCSPVYIGVSFRDSNGTLIKGFLYAYPFKNNQYEYALLTIRSQPYSATLTTIPNSQGDTLKNITWYFNSQPSCSSPGSPIQYSNDINVITYSLFSNYNNYSVSYYTDYDQSSTEANGNVYVTNKNSSSYTNSIYLIRYDQAYNIACPGGVQGPTAGLIVSNQCGTFSSCNAQCQSPNGCPGGSSCCQGSSTCIGPGGNTGSTYYQINGIGGYGNSTQTGQSCPPGASGSPPNCVCQSGQVYNSSTNTCTPTGSNGTACPNNTSGAYPNCVCPSGQEYDSSTNSCTVTHSNKTLYTIIGIIAAIALFFLFIFIIFLVIKRHKSENS